MLKAIKLITPEGELLKVRREAILCAGLTELPNSRADTHHVYLEGDDVAAFEAAAGEIDYRLQQLSGSEWAIIEGLDPY